MVSVAKWSKGCWSLELVGLWNLSFEFCFVMCVWLAFLGCYWCCWFGEVLLLSVVFWEVVVLW